MPATRDLGRFSPEFAQGNDSWYTSSDLTLDWLRAKVRHPALVQSARRVGGTSRLRLPVWARVPPRSMQFLRRFWTAEMKRVSQVLQLAVIIKGRRPLFFEP